MYRCSGHFVIVSDLKFPFRLGQNFIGLEESQQSFVSKFEMATALADSSDVHRF